MNKQYRVYNKHGEYHHAYNASLEGALNWAIDCAKRVGGSVKLIRDNDKEVEVFNCAKEVVCSH